MKNIKALPVLSIVIPCYNEESVLPITFEMFSKKIKQLINENRINKSSFILYVNDGSKDNTWNIISDFAKKYKYVKGISLSRNRGHQFALVAGLMEAKVLSDITISIDCDGQDDLDAMNEMVDCYNEGYDIVYGVRSSRQTDTFFKRFTAQTYYKILNLLGAEVVYNHADYRLVSCKVLKEFENYKEVNLYLRGLFPLIGFESTTVYYERKERLAGESHYPLSKMLALAFEGITSLTIKPIKMILLLGVFVMLGSFVMLIVLCASRPFSLETNFISVLASIIMFVLGLMLLSIGVIGEYIGKTYLETKQRPRYIISKRTYRSINN